MPEIMYDLPTGLIAGVLLAALIFAVGGGYRLGLRRSAAASEALRSHIAAIQNSLLGVLALILGFTFSLALQRFDTRSDDVVTEANAIGTTYLRADLLPETVRAETKALLRAYVEKRVEAGAETAHHAAHFERLHRETGELQGRLWALAARAGREEPNPVTTGLYIQTLNDTIDAVAKRESGLARHVPELVLWLLFGTLLMTSVVIGVGAGVSNHRPSLATYVLVILIVMLVALIVDLDRPRRGLIEVSQQSMLDLQRGVADAAGDQPGNSRSSSSAQ